MWTEYKLLAFTIFQTILVRHMFAVSFLRRNAISFALKEYRGSGVGVLCGTYAGVILVRMCDPAFQNLPHSHTGTWALENETNSYVHRSKLSCRSPTSIFHFKMIRLRVLIYSEILKRNTFFPSYLAKANTIWTASNEFGTYRLCEQRRFRRACASAQSRQNLRCSLIQAVSQEEPSDRKPNPWPLWMAGHAQLKFVMTECSKTQRTSMIKAEILPKTPRSGGRIFKWCGGCWN